MMKKRLMSVMLALCMALSMGLTAACSVTEDSTKESPKDSASASESESPKPNKYAITVENGTGSGTYEENTDATIVADAKEDYAFAGWSSEGKVVSTEATYVFKVTGDKTFTATYVYDYSVWDGTTPETAPASYVIDEEKRTLDLNDVSAFIYFRSLLQATSATDYYKGFKGNTFDNATDLPLNETDAAYKTGYVININCNMDFSDQTWIGIDDETPMLDGCVINGNNHVIKGMTTNMNSSLAGVRGWATGGFFTMIGSNQKLTINDLTFKNASVTGGGQIGVVVGGVYRVDLTLDNVNVINSYVNGETGHKIGALIGRVGNCGDGSGDHEKITIKNCNVENTTIAGMRNLSALVGAIFSSTPNVTVFDENYDYYQDQPMFKGWVTALAGKSPVPGYRVYEASKAWFTGAVACIKAKINGEESVCTWTVEEAKTQLANYEGFVATGEAYTASVRQTYEKAMKNDVKKNLTIENNTVKNCTLITWAPHSEEGKNETTNSAVLYTFNDKMYDNFQTVETDELTTNIVENNKKINTFSFVNNANGKKPLYISTSLKFGALLNEYNLETDLYVGVTDIYIAGTLDLTAIMAENEDYATLVLPSTLTIHFINGATLKGIPDSVLANVTKDYIAE